MARDCTCGISKFFQRKWNITQYLRGLNITDGKSTLIPFDANKLPMSFSKQFLGNGWRWRKVLMPSLMDFKRVRLPFYSFINFPNKRGLRGLLLANTTLNFPPKQTHHDALSSLRCLSKNNGFIWSSTEKFHFCNHWEKRWFSSGFSAAAALFCKHARNINNYGLYLSFANHYFCNERNRVIIGKNCEKWACNLMIQAFLSFNRKKSSTTCTLFSRKDHQKWVLHFLGRVRIAQTKNE